MVDKTPKPTPSPSPNPKSGLTPSEEARIAAESAPKTTSGAGKGLTGAPIGTEIIKGIGTVAPFKEGLLPTKVTAKTQYKYGDGMVAFATLSAPERIQLLAILAQIPGLYSKKTAPTQEYLINVARSKMVPVRKEDVTALENVMRYADTVGEDYKTAAQYLVSNPQVAQGFFDISGTKAGKAKEISLTPADALALELEQSALDYLDFKVTKAEKTAYAKKINDLERKRGGALTALERNQLLIDTIQNKARELFKADEEKPDSLLTRKGALGATFNIIRDEYRDYGIPINDTQIYKQAISSIRSKQALDNILGKVRLQAEVSMPAIKSYIQQGLTPREALGSYINLYSKVYQVPENQVDLTKLAPVYSGDKIMPYQDWQKYIYSMPEFTKTKMYQDQKLEDANTLIRNFIG